MSPLAGELSTCPLPPIEEGLLPLPGEPPARGDPEGRSTKLEIRLSRSVRSLARDGAGAAIWKESVLVGTYLDHDLTYLCRCAYALSTARQFFCTEFAIALDLLQFRSLCENLIFARLKA